MEPGTDSFPAALQNTQIGQTGCVLRSLEKEIGVERVEDETVGGHAVSVEGAVERGVLGSADCHNDKGHSCYPGQWGRGQLHPFGSRLEGIRSETVAQDRFGRCCLHCCGLRSLAAVERTQQAAQRLVGVAGDSSCKEWTGDSTLAVAFVHTAADAESSMDEDIA